MPPFHALSLFSGCGGDTLGLERAGGTVDAFSEFNKAATQTHLHNFPGSVHLVEGGSSDITKLSDSVFEPYRGKIDVVFAGFPCQGFSKAGKKSATDPRNQMFRQFVRVAKIVKPRYIIGENVTGLLTMASGPAETDPLVLDIIKDEFRKIGYEITHQIMEATEVGVPQKRKRLFLVGWRTDGPELVPASFWAQVAAWGAAQTMPTLRSFVQPCLQDAYPLEGDTVPEGFANVALEVAANAGVTGSVHPFVRLKADAKLLSCSKRGSPIHSEVINLDNPSKTIICTYDHQPRLLVGLKREGGGAWVRTLYTDELKQIQGFPATFTVLGSRKEQVVQVGNAVPPALVEAVARALFP